MAVVGFDFGNESCVIACIRRKQIEVLQNESGSRKTATCVGFSGNQRMLGGDGIASLSSIYKNCVIPVKRLLGRRLNDRFMEDEAPYLTTKVTAEKNGMMITVKYDSKTRQFPPESLCAMQLGKLKRTAEKGLGMPVKDCVIGVPSYWNDQQRRAMLNAAKICGLNVMRLMNETTAVALNYGILRPITTDIKVLFVDMGYSSVNVSLVSFGKGKLQVLGTATDANLGGRNFDKLLMDHFANMIKNKYKMDVLTNEKSKMKLRKECTRVKKVLSANKKVMFNVEYIMNDTDVKGEVTREEFEKMSVHLQDRMLASLNEVLAAACVQKNELHSLEVVGGAVRIPCVKAKLKEWFEGKNLSATCDGDESVARGCALQCAMLAPFIKVRDFEVNDVTPYGIQLYWQPYTPDDKRTLAEMWSEDCTNSPVPSLNPIPYKGLIVFKDKTEPFQVIAKYADNSKLPADTEAFLGRWVVSNIPAATHPSNEGKAPKIKVKFQLDINGIFSISSVTSVESYEIEVEEEVKVEIKPEEEATDMDVNSETVKENAENDPSVDQTSPEQGKAEVPEKSTGAESNDQTGAQNKKDDNADNEKMDTTGDSQDKTKSAEKESQDETAEQDKTAEKGNKDEVNKDENTKDGKKEEKPKKEKPKYRIEKVKKMKSKKNRVSLPVGEEFVVQMDEATLEIWIKEERTMLKKDLEIQETNELRNSLEGYVLEMRGKLEGDLSPYMNEGPRDEFLKRLNAMEDWLYEDGFDAEKAAFEERLKNLRLTGDPVSKRSIEAKRRPDCIRDLYRAIAEMKALADSKDKNYDHIPKEERDKALNKCKETEEWIKKELKKQDPLSLADDPIVLCATIESRKKNTVDYCAKIMNKPKPKPKKVEKEKDDKAKSKDGDKENDKKETDDKTNGDKHVEKTQTDEKTKIEDDPAMDLGCD